MSQLTSDPKPGEAAAPLFGDFSVDEYRPMKIIVIGAGAGGILAGVRFQQYIPNLTLAIYEKLDGIGGTWYANRYPGLTCDVPSHCYQFSFEHKTDWSQIYPPAHEILSYLRHVADKYNVTPHVKLRHELRSAKYDEATGKWHVRVKRPSESDPSGFEEFDDEADFVFSAMGSLSRWKWPDIEGVHDFKGKLIHSATWDVSEEELNTWGDKKVGVIGLGSSAVQCVSALGPKVGKLYNFVRGKVWVAPPLIAQKMSELLGRDVTLDPLLSFTEEEKKSFAEDPKKYIEFRRKIEHDYNGLHQVTLRDSPIQQYARATFTAYMKQMLEKKPELADLLMPDFSVSCRRLTPTPGYLRAIVQDNCDVVAPAIKRITPTGVETEDGKTYDLDVLVCATGFDTSFRYPFPIIGRNGVDLRDKWTPHPQTYLSLCVDGFPNLFFTNGPNTCVGTTSLWIMMEHQVLYAVHAAMKLQRERLKSIEPKREAIQDFEEWIEDYFPKSVFSEPVRTWYKDGKAEGRVMGIWPGSNLHHLRVLRYPRWEDFNYEQLDKTNNRFHWFGNGMTVGEKALVDDRSWYLDEKYVDIPPVALAQIANA